MTRKTVRIITLGCAKNEVDSEEIAGVLTASGNELTAEESCDVTVINTCGFLEAAKDESIQAIREAVAAKEEGRTGKVIVAGCLSQRLGEELRQLAPGADLYVGVGQMTRFAEYVSSPKPKDVLNISVKPSHLWANLGTRLNSQKPWSAYLKVSEGCDHRCTFCTIPSFRGPHVSKPIERVVAEAEILAARGVKEINLIAQDVTQYGYDLYKTFTMPRLLKELSAIDGVQWLRLLYCYPNRLTDEVIDTMASLEKVCHYIDVPLQHVHPEILRAMKRPWDGERYLKLFQKLRSSMPDVAIRTTFIVGFPGETDEHFNSLLDFIDEAKLDRVGAFVYSREPGTPSYFYDHQVPADVKQSRYDELMSRQQAISLRNNKAWRGKRLRVLVEGAVDENWSVGRSHRDAPDIDGLVFVAGEHAPGEFVDCTIDSVEPYDLFGYVGKQRRRKVSPLRLHAPSSPL